MAGTAGVAGSSVGNDPLTVACSAICAAQSGLACEVSSCTSDCRDFGIGSDKPSLYLAMVQCEARSMTSVSDYVCSNLPLYPLTGNGPAPYVNPAASSPCKAEICAYTCASSLYDGNVCTACACPFTC